MKYIILILLFKVIIRVLDFLDRIFEDRKLKYYREELDNRCENLQIVHDTKNNRMSDLFIFRPFEISKVKYKNQSRISEKPTYPKPRSGHRIVCSDSAIYCFGGFNPNLAVDQNEMEDGEATCLFQELWKYDIINKNWQLLLNSDNELPMELASNAMIMQGNTIVVFGGTGFPFGVNCSNKLYAYHPGNQKRMEEIETHGEKPPPQYGQAIVCHDNYLYTIGGTEGFDYTCDVFRLNLLTRIWECMYICRQDIRDDPPGRYRHEIAYDKKYIYVIGGGTSDSAFDLKNIPTYDLENNVWLNTRTFPDANGYYPGGRKCHSCVQVRRGDDVEVIVAGGYDGRKYHKDVWKLSLKTLQWRCMVKSRLTFPLFFHDAATNDDGCMYIFGGIKYNNQTNVRTDIIYKMWTTIPKLSAICWEAMLHYYPKLPDMPKAQLLEAGIPLNFVKRIHS